ncbi:site-specific integrase [Micrococcus luteus]|uniref:tyrosine-type recombinase/integrase n=1 Tax=Micrococcus luteus TaxID=1270 RepID=UPI00342097EA
MWIGRVELPAGPDGKRRRKQVASRSFDTAAAELRKLRADVDEGRIAVTGSTTLGEWLDRWLDEIHAQRIRPTTLRDYRTAVDLHIKPAIGNKRIDKLTPQHVRQMHIAIGRRRAAEKAHVILQKALKDAIREGMITRNVAELVDKPKYARGKRQSMSVDLARTVIATAYASLDEARATRWAAAFLTGARQSELLGLRWEYVDLEAGLMDISWQLQQLPQVHGCGDPVDGRYPCGKGGPGWCPQRRWDLPPDFEFEECHRSLVFTRPKTEAGSRPVPIVAPLLAKLVDLHAGQGVNPHGLVWHYPDGRPMGPREDHQEWTRLLEASGAIEPGETLSLHVARHTTATLLRAAGVDEQTRMEILGHATVDSQRVYAHADRQRHIAAMGSLGELLG